jgi:hypothetical protein
MKILSLAGVPLLALISLTGCGGVAPENESLGTVEQGLDCTYPASPSSPADKCAGSLIAISPVCGASQWAHYCTANNGGCIVWNCNANWQSSPSDWTCERYLKHLGC